MLTLALNFLAGRYHATPWGRHVNEADVAWPPDLWRFTRSLIATWHRKLDHNRFPIETLEALLAALAAEAPQYCLPMAVHAHTRHYMPNRQKSTLIFDAFARIDPNDELIMHWPEMVLENKQILLLDELLLALGYLGRAESWIEAKRLPKWEGIVNCWPGETVIDIDTGEVSSEPVQLYLPMPKEKYLAFQSDYLQGLDASKLTNKEHNKIKNTLEKDWLKSLSLDTAHLQADGWNAPPCAQKVLYQRPLQALRNSVASYQTKVLNKSANTVRYAIYGKPLTRIEDTLKFGEWLRYAVMGKAKRLLGAENIPVLISGHGLPQDNLHQHAFFIPEANSQGRIDHALIHIPAGFDSDTRFVLENLDNIWNRDGQEWQLILEYIGEKAQFEASVPILKQSLVWQSATPYLHPWHTKKNFDIEAQIRRECKARGLSEIIALEKIETVDIAGRSLRPVDYHRFRNKRGLIQPDSHGSFWRITFADQASGPILLGFGCHFGLGLFIPNV